MNYTKWLCQANKFKKRKNKYFQILVKIAQCRIITHNLTILNRISRLLLTQITNK